MRQIVMTAAALAALAVPALVVAAASPAHADPSTSEIVEDSWESTCNQLSKELTGSPAGDMAVLVSISQNLANFYQISMHDASKAVGEIIGSHCPQYETNVNAAQKWATDNDA
jgi:type IV secretory pathway VirB2 component (pilin)